MLLRVGMIGTMVQQTIKAIIEVALIEMLQTCLRMYFCICIATCLLICCDNGCVCTYVHMYMYMYVCVNVSSYGLCGGGI